MFNPGKTIQIIVDNENLGSVKIKASRRTMARTLLERGDPHYLFHDEIVLEKASDR